MHKAAITMFIFVIMLLTIAHSTKAEQLEYIGFEGFQVIENSQSISITANVTGVTKSYTYVLSFSSAKYLSSMTFANIVQNCDYPTDPPAHITIDVSVNGQQVASKTFYIAPSTLNINWTPVRGTDFTVTVTVTVVGPSTTVTNSFSSSKQYFYVSSEPYKIVSLLTGLKYVPPGADSTATGFVLNQTEVYLNNSHTLPEGTISFWLKWDGSTNVQLADNIGIDANGHIYIKNDAGTTYTLEGVTPPVGTYVPVYIGWRAGEGYIMLNTTKITLNWAGNVTIAKVGSVSQDAGTIIDEFKVWDTYISPDQVIYESKKELYTLLYNNTTITIKPEGGTSLGIINVAFLDANYTTLNSTTLSSGQKTAIVPPGTAIVVLTRGSVSRTYVLAKYDTITFPAEEAQVIVTRISVRPSSWSYLTVKTVAGAVATRIQLENNEGSFIAVYGNQYLFVFERSNETRARVYTVSTGDIVFYILDSDITFKPPIDVKVYLQNSTIVVQYYDANLETSSVDVTVVGYKNYMKAWEIHDYQSKQFGLYTLKVDSNNTEYAGVIIKANVDGQIQEYKHTIYIEGAVSRSPFPQELIPTAFLILGFALVPMFLFRAIEVHMMLLGGAIGLSIGALLGWIPAMPSLITILTILGIVAMIVYRRG